MKSPFGLLWIATLATILICGCSGVNTRQAPTIPDLNSPAQSERPDSPLTASSEVPVSSYSGHYLWLYEQIYIDPSTLQVEVIPSRQTPSHFNVLTWLENGPCTTCFKLVKLVPSGSGTILADIQVKHPFANPNLTGFDVCGIAMFNASRTFPESGLTFSDPSAGDGAVVNPDGYTTL